MDGSLTDKLNQTITDAPAAAAAVATSEPPAVPAEPSKVTDGSGKQPAKPAVPEVYDWTKDKRYETMWKKDVNGGLYKSYREVEKLIEPTKRELDALKADKTAMTELAKSYGITLEQIKDVFEDYKTYKDPEALHNQYVSSFKKWVDNEKTMPRLDKLIRDFQEEEWAEKYPGMTAETRAKVQVQEERLQKLETDEKNRTFQSNVEKQKKDLLDNLASIKKDCTEYGYDFTKDIEVKLLDYCEKNGINTNAVYAEFIKQYGKDLRASYAEKVKTEQLQTLNKNKQGAVPGPGASAPGASASGGSLLNRLKTAAGIN
uniref:Uncharacterized protein n=1 Tax=viral metagenome TaxID=1070528 RepID=A0A6M3LJH1_9ZZZZ